MYFPLNYPQIVKYYLWIIRTGKELRNTLIRTCVSIRGSLLSSQLERRCRKLINIINLFLLSFWKCVMCVRFCLV